jgi:superfamily II DNA/RNA helicase
MVVLVRLSETCRVATECRPLSGKDLRVPAETGSSITVFYLIPVWYYIMSQTNPTASIRLLILVPGRKLPLHVTKDSAALCRLNGQVPLGSALRMR